MAAGEFYHFLEETKTALAGADFEIPAVHIELLLSTAFAASLRQDELRRVSFRILFADIATIKPGPYDRSSFQPASFDKPRPFKADELRSLAPAVGFSRSMIVVWPDADGILQIQGIVYTGAQWLRVMQGGRGLQKLIPDGFIVHVLAPGSMETRHGANILSQIKFGARVPAGIDVFESTWLLDKFAYIRAGLLEEFESTREPGALMVDPLLFGRLSQQMIKRMIAAIQGNHHGGAVLFGPQTTFDTAIEERAITLRQTFVRNPATARHRNIMLKAARIMTTLAGNVASRKVGWDEYVNISHASLNDLDDALFDEAYLAGGLAGADGSVVLNDQFELVGFGTEIFAHDVVVDHIWKAQDNNGEFLVQETADSYGTRHRSAFRFVKKYPEALAVVISQDGDVRFIVNIDDKVVLFTHEAALVVELVL